MEEEAKQQLDKVADYHLNFELRQIQSSLPAESQGKAAARKDEFGRVQLTNVFKTNESDLLTIFMWFIENSCCVFFCVYIRLLWCNWTI